MIKLKVKKVGAKTGEQGFKKKFGAETGLTCEVTLRRKGWIRKSWRQETGPQITPSLFFLLMRRTGMVKKDNDRQQSSRLGKRNRG